MDPVTLRAVAEIARQRAALAKSSVLRERLQDKRDGLERLVAARWISSHATLRPRQTISKRIPILPATEYDRVTMTQNRPLTAR